MHEGQIIRFIRKEKKISQANLAKDICSVRHLSNIESGKSSVSYDLIMKFMQKLGTNLNLILNEDIQKYGFQLFKEFLELEELFQKWKYQELYTQVTEMNNKYMFESYILKKIMYYKAICIQEVENNTRRSQEILLSQLDIRSVNEVSKTLKKYNDALDLDIINALAVSLSNSNDKHMSLGIFQSIKAYLINYQCIDTGFGVKTLYNIVKNQFDLNLFEECLKTAHECIKVCKKNNIYKYFPDTYIYMARAMQNLEIGGFEKYFKRGIYLFSLFGDFEKMHKNIDFIMKKYGLEIDFEVLKEEV